MRLSDCFIELIAYVVYFLKTAAKNQPGFDQIRADIERLMSEGRESIRYGEIPDADYDMARFAICAWIDESIMNSDWKDKMRWQREPLQRLYYQTTNAGELFFDRLNAIGAHQKDVREIFYLCLSMGFMGRYGNEGDQYLLEQLKTSNLKVLTGTSVGIPSLEKGLLFPEAYPPETDSPAAGPGQNRFSMTTLAVAGAPVALFTVLFIIYHFVLSNVSETLFSLVP
ncbi:MAG TPA: DotU family type IV/VI secretion system protein [Deltaproteobacteria bacterium]|nr:DotU family type IV/VI secretion system protein [Deltaproteobacteria bacterium]